MSEKVFLFSKFSELSSKEKGLLALGCLGAFFKSFHFVWLNGLVFNSYYKAFGIADFPFLCLMSALCLVLCGLGVYKVTSFVSSFGGRLLFLCFLAQVALCAGLYFSAGFSRIMVVFLFPFILFVQAVFYNAVFRFVLKDFESKKFFSLVCFDILGLIAGGQLLMLFKNYTLKGLITGSAVSFFVAALAVQRLEKEPNFVFQRPAQGFLERLKKQERGFFYLFNMLLFVKAAFAGLVFFRFYELFYFFCLQKDLSFVWMMGALSSVLGGVLFFILFSFFQKGRRIRPIVGETGYLLTTVFWGFSFLKDSFAGACLAAEIFLILLYFWEGFYESALFFAARLKRKSASFLRQKALVEPAGATAAMLVVFLFVEKQVFFWGVFSGLAMVFLIYLTGKKYAELMKKKLLEEPFMKHFFPVLMEKNLFCFLSQSLKKDESGKKAYFLKIFENSRHPFFKEKVSLLLCDSSPAIRLKALQTVGRCRLYSKKKQVADLLAQDSSDFIKKEALAVLISLSEEKETLFWVKKYLRDEKMKSGVLQGLLAKGTSYADQALEYLNPMVVSLKAAQRKEVGCILCASPSKKAVSLVRNLCGDADLSVRKKAFEAAGKMRSARLAPALIEALQDEKTKSDAFDALLQMGPVAFAPIKSALKDKSLPFEVKKELVLLLGLSDKDASIGIYAALLPLTSLKVQREIYHQMEKIEKECGAVLPKEPLLKSVSQNLKGLEFIFIQEEELSGQNTSFSKKEVESFSSELQEFKNILRKNVLSGFYFMYSLKVFRRAVQALMAEKKEEFSASFGILEDVLPKKYAARALPLLKKSMTADKV